MPESAEQEFLVAERPSRKLAVILHADVVGSTTLVQKDETLAHERIQDSFRRFSKTIEVYGGMTHELRGDALVAKFGRASDAVMAATAFQKNNEEFLATLNDEIQPRLRVGIAMGEMVIADKAIIGSGVALAQRLEQLADPGGVCIHGAIHETVPKRLPFEYRSKGEQVLKGFDEPVRTYAVTLKAGIDVPAPESVDRSVKATLELSDKPSLAVLPFTNMSDESEQDYFGVGISEDIITALSRISDIFVIARNSNSADKGTSRKTKDVARDLGVRYLLEGSVRKIGYRVRVTAQLIDATTEQHLWAEHYDRDLDDIFAIQDDITREVVVALQVTLTAGEMARQWAGGTHNREAWECMIAGRERHLRFTAEDNAIARRLFERALDIDPNYGSARVWLGFTHWIDAHLAYTRDPALSLELAQRQVEQLEGSEHGRSIAQLLVGSIHLLKGEHEEAIRAARAAVEFSHGAGDHANLGMILHFAGEPAEAIKELKTAVRLSPYHANWFLYYLSEAYLWHGDVERAIEVGNEYLARRSDDPFAYANLAVICGIGGRNSEAKDFVAKLLANFPTFSVSYFASAQHYKDPAQLERVLQALREAGLPD